MNKFKFEIGDEVKYISPYSNECKLSGFIGAISSRVDKLHNLKENHYLVKILEDYKNEKEKGYLWAAESNLISTKIDKFNLGSLRENMIVTLRNGNSYMLRKPINQKEHDEEYSFGFVLVNSKKVIHANFYSNMRYNYIGDDVYDIMSVRKPLVSPDLTESRWLQVEEIWNRRQEEFVELTIDEISNIIGQRVKIISKK